MMLTVNLMRVDVGFDPAGVLTAWVAPQPDGDMTDRSSVALTDTVDRVRQIRGVEAVAAVFGTSPAGAGVAAIKIAIPGRTREGGEQVLASIVTADYHRVLRIPLHAGRYFDESDRHGSEPVVLLGAATARQYFAGADPVGDVIDVNGRSGRPGSLLTLAPHRSGRAGSAASGSSTDGFATRRRVPAGPGSQAMATAIPKACLASSAIRCRDVETGPNLGVLAVFPSTGATCRCPLPSTGSRGLNSPASAVL